MKFANLILFLLTCSWASAQNLIITDAFIKATGSSSVIQFDSSTGSIAASGGGIQTEKSSGVVWRIAGSELGQYRVPFADQYGAQIPVKFQRESVGQLTDHRFRTWKPDSADQSQFGSSVFLKRLWRIDGLQQPALIELKYSDSDIPQSLLGESLLSITRLWKGQWRLAQNTVVDPLQNSVSYVADDSASYSTTWGVIEIDIPLSSNIRWIDYECNSSELVWESDRSDYMYVIYGSNDGRAFTAIDSSRTQSRLNSARIGPKYKYLKIEQKFDDQTHYESKLIKTCSVRIPLHLEVYPNPTAGRLWIENAVQPEVEVRDLNGRSMLVAASSQFDISGLTNGVYFVNVHDGDLSKNFRIVKI